MNRTASSTFANQKSAVKTVAKLDLTDEAQRRIHELVHRFQSGRWPLFRCLGMRQVSGTLYEAYLVLVFSVGGHRSQQLCKR